MSPLKIITSESQSLYDSSLFRPLKDAEVLFGTRLEFNAVFHGLGEQMEDRYGTVGRTCGRLSKRIATQKVTMVPKKIHQGNSMTGSQAGCG